MSLLRLVSVENRFLINFMYGQAFFVLGLAAAFQYRASSQFRLANALLSLSLFGLIHATGEWGQVFIPLQATWLPPSYVLGLQIIRLVLTALSFALLFHFGLQLFSESRLLSPWLRLIPWLVLGGWYGALMVRFAQHPGFWPQARLMEFDAIARYLLALPGSLITAASLYMQMGQFTALGLERRTAALRWAAGGFIFYGFISGVVGPPTSFFPGTWLNSEALFKVIGMPVEVFRTGTVVVIAFAMVRVLALFNLEAQRRLDEAETQSAVLSERLRISRDLHDGVLQSIYGVGLNLESTTYILRENPEQAGQNLEKMMGKLNEVIRDIRSYVLNLRPARISPEEPYLAILEEAAQFRQMANISARLAIDGLRSIRLAPGQTAELSAITREALTNVARHSQASEVWVRAQCNGTELVLSITDNGAGFGSDDKRSEGQGLGNMATRAAILGGQITVESRRGRGTEVRVRIPVGGVSA